jgi:D-alanyl-D-alanine-carboxypeptidase/D-alanyl-D-alanine-endopeptidase
MRPKLARMGNAVSRLALLSLLVANLALAQPPPNPRAPTDAEIRSILADRIDQSKQGVGIVVGVIEPQGRRTVSYGAMGLNDGRTINGDSVFEIGSITKVFTSLLLSNMAERGEVALTDPVAKHLPVSVRVPERGGKQITLMDLATHTSGLPRMPENFKPRDPARPYEDYSPEQLYSFLSAYHLRRDIGSKFEYSNLGVALLGRALALRAGTDYETLVRTRILDPLGMNDTRISLTPKMQATLAAGHGYTNLGLERVPNWELSVFSGAGALRSTTNDMLTFLAAFLGFTETPLKRNMSTMLDTRRPAGWDEKIALGWLVRTPKTCLLACRSLGNDIVWHNGGTGGYQSFIGFDPKNRVGVAILSNAGYGVGVTDIGMHILNPRLSLASPKSMRLPKVREVVAVAPAVLESYVGRYQFPDKDIWTIRRDGNRLFASHPADPENEIFAESDHDFFFKTLDAQIQFEKGAGPRATGLVVHGAGTKSRRAIRIN